MRLSFHSGFRLILLASVIAGRPGALQAASEPARPRATLSVLHFPKHWIRADDSRAILTEPAAFELRRDRTHPEIRLITLLDAIGNYSIDAYRFSLSGRPAPQAVQPQVFSAASPEKSTTPQLLFAADVTQRRVSFAGQNFRASGQRLARPAALASPDGKRLLVFSHLKKRRHDTNFMGSDEPSQGTLFIDLFDVATGKQLADFHWKYSGFAPSILFANARWFGSELFLIPLDFMVQDALLGVLRSPS